MAVAPELAAVMLDTITWEPMIGSNQYAEPAGYGTPVKIRCRIDGATDEVRDVNGLVKISRNRIYLDDVYPIDPKDRITLPDGSRPVILSVNNLSGPTPGYMNYTEIIS